MLLELKHPELLWLVLIPTGFCVWSLIHHRQSKLEYSWLRLVLGPLALALCIVGLARPQLGHRITETRATTSNLFIALDISRSMLAEDVSPNRLRFSVAFSQRLLSRLDGSRIALYPFSGDGYIQMPLTADTAAVADMLTTMDPSMTSNQSTDLSTAMNTLMENIVRMEDKAVSRGASWAAPQVLLFSDGESHNPLRGEVFQKFKRKGIPIFTVGVGTTEGAPLRLPNAFGGLEPLRSNGRIVRSVLDPENLRKMSEITGGSYFRSSFSEIPALSRRLRQSLQFGRLSTQFKAEKELFPILLTLGVLLFCWELLLGRWQFVLRLWIGWLLLGSPAYADPSPTEERIRAIQLYNEAVETLGSGGNLDKAAEKFQESAFLTRDPGLKKKALFALGNTMLKLKDPEQALAIYQEARDIVPKDTSFNKDANNRISDNMVLARQIQQQMSGQKSQDPNESGKGKQNQDPQDRKGPQNNYKAQHFDDAQKQKIFDLIASEEQEILKKLRQRQQRNKPQQAKGKPW